MKSVQSVVEKWKRNLSSSTQSMKDGILAVTTAPGQAAARQKEKWIRKLQEAAASGKWEQAVQAVPLAEWQDKMINLGLPRIASGAAAGAPKVSAFMDQFLPFVERAAAEVQQMPNATLEDSIQRAAAMIRKNASFKYRKRSG